jgi:hypothetical protein
MTRFDHIVTLSTGGTERSDGPGGICGGPDDAASPTGAAAESQRGRGGIGNTTQIGPLPQLITRKVGNIPTCFFRFFKINTCHHVFDHWATIPSGIPNVCNVEDLHKSRVNRLAKEGKYRTC